MSSFVVATSAAPQTSLSAEDKAAMLALFQSEKKTWPNASAEKIEKDLKSALVVAVAREVDAKADEAAAAQASAASSGAVVGFIVLSGVAHDPLLEHLVVSSACRGKGLGKQLVEVALASTVIDKAPAVDLYCYHNVAPFYEKLGFKVVRKSDDVGTRWLLRRARPSAG